MASTLLIVAGFLAVVYFFYSFFKKAADIRREDSPQPVASTGTLGSSARNIRKTTPSKPKVALSEDTLSLIRRLDTSENVTITVSVPKAITETSAVWQDIKSVVRALSAFSTVLLVTDAGDEKSIIDLVHNFFDGLVPVHRILIHSTLIGKVAIVRQVTPAIHIEFDPSASDQTSPHVRVLFVGTQRERANLTRQPWRSVVHVKDIL